MTEIFLKDVEMGRKNGGEDPWGIIAKKKLERAEKG